MDKFANCLIDEKNKDLRFPFTFYTLEAQSIDDSEKRMVSEPRKIEMAFYSTTHTSPYSFYKPISKFTK